MSGGDSETGEASGSNRLSDIEDGSSVSTSDDDDTFDKEKAALMTGL